MNKQVVAFLDLEPHPAPGHLLVAGFAQPSWPQFPLLYGGDDGRDPWRCLGIR